MTTTRGGIVAAKTNAPVRKPAEQTLRNMIAAMRSQIQAALPSVLTPERFTRMVFTAISNTPQLAECSPQSFLGAMMQAAQLGVEPNTPLGQAYLIPYRNHGNLEAQFQLGYKGMMDLAYRSGEVTDIAAHTVHENDEFEYELGLTPKLRHKPALKDRGAAIMYYAVFHTKGGGYGFQVMSVQDVMEHGKAYSKSFGGGFSPWKTNFDEMAKKTVLKKCLKYAPLKTEFMRGIVSDETIKTKIAPNMADAADETVYETVYEQEAGTAPQEQEAAPAPQQERSVDTETGEILDGRDEEPKLNL